MEGNQRISLRGRPGVHHSAAPCATPPDADQVRGAGTQSAESTWHEKRTRIATLCRITTPPEWTTTLCSLNPHHHTRALMTAQNHSLLALQYSVLSIVIHATLTVFALPKRRLGCQTNRRVFCHGDDEPPRRPIGRLINTYPSQDTSKSVVV